MLRNAAVILFALVVFVQGAVANLDPTDAALQDAELFDVLEARLIQRLQEASGDVERTKTIARLADVYVQLLRDLPAGSGKRATVADRAWDLVDRAGERQASELRLMLLIDGYVEIERAVALLEIGLLSKEDQGRHAIELARINAWFESISSSTGSVRGANSSQDPEVVRRAEEAIRVRSLSNYYAGWSGLLLSILEDRRPADTVQNHFGWLLGSEGGLPKLDDVRDSALALDHVARSAVGVARAKHRSGDSVLAGIWIAKVIESESASDRVRQQAITRRLRMLAEDRSWSDLARSLYEIQGTGSNREPLSTQDARYFAFRALAEIQGGMSGPVIKVAEFAVEDLVERGEIGHILELRDRFGSLPTLGDGFVARYADGLERLAAAEQSGSPIRYLDAAAVFRRAIDASDANRFESQRADSSLKRVYCLVRGGRPAEAAVEAGEFIEQTSNSEAREEAAWLFIIALETAGDVQRESDLESAVIEYLAEYAGSERARMLLVRYASAGLLEDSELVERLRGIPEGDRVIGEAKRILVGMMYRDWIASGRTDEELRSNMVVDIRWLWDDVSDRSISKKNARSALGTARIAIELALSREPLDPELAEQALNRCDAALDADIELEGMAPEIQLRRVEWLTAIDQLEEAVGASEVLRFAGSKLSDEADRMILAAAFRRVDNDRDDSLATQIVLNVGVRVIDGMMPLAPEPLGIRTSSLVSRLIEVAVAQGTEPPSHHQLALRLGRVLLERGMPTAQTVRELAAVARVQADQETELLAWSVLLAASDAEDESWWESRYQSLRLIRLDNPTRAEEIYQQHKLLYPMPGVLPWTRMIDELFQSNQSSESQSGRLVDD
ncbi:MAG: hypothetical protein AB8F26_02010 [Phycisphaerales bacterium]